MGWALPPFHPSLRTQWNAPLPRVRLAFVGLLRLSDPHTHCQFTGLALAYLEKKFLSLRPKWGSASLKARYWLQDHTKLSQL